MSVRGVPSSLVGGPLRSVDRMGRDASDLLITSTTESVPGPGDRFFRKLLLSALGDAGAPPAPVSSHMLWGLIPAPLSVF